MKYLQVTRFDATDEHVFERAAEPGELVVSGAFRFADDEEDALKGKRRQAFANGLLALPSLGDTTFASVCEVDAATVDDLETALARHFLDHYGAPDLGAARAAAAEEIGFIKELCAEKPINTVFAVARSLEPDGLHEAFREVAASREADHARIWDVVADDA